MSGPARPWDSGLQIERTKLSWQRTALSALAFCLIAARLVAIYSWGLGIGLGLVALLVALLLGFASTRRYVRGNLALVRETLLPDARAFLAFVALVLVAGCGALIYLFASWTA